MEETLLNALNQRGQGRMRDTFHSIHLVVLLQLLFWVGRFPLLGRHMQQILIGIPMLAQSHTIIKFLANLYTLHHLMLLLLTMVVIWVLVLVCNPHTSHTCEFFYIKSSVVRLENYH